MVTVAEWSFIALETDKKQLREFVNASPKKSNIFDMSKSITSAH